MHEPRKSFRAQATRDYLVRLGIPDGRIEVVSFGEESPAAPGSGEGIWAKNRRAELDQRTTLFVDEVHRWNKAQQDALLPHVENGTIVLVGATTENPYFEVIKALVSRILAGAGVHAATAVA